MNLSIQSDGEEGDHEDEGVGSDVDKTYEVQFIMSPEPEEEEKTTAEGRIQCKSKQSLAR